MYFKHFISYVPFRLLVLAFVLWSNSSFAPPIKNVGFYCDDESIKQPFHGDTIHFAVLLAILLGLFPFLMYITEVKLRKSDVENELAKSKYRFLMQYYYTGFLLVLGFTEALKCFVCELRPHFYTTCLPDMKNIKCSDGLITDFTCTGQEWPRFIRRDIYKSFPSGHASLSLYSYMFLNICLCSRIKSEPTSALSHLWSQTVLFVWSCSLSVISFMWIVFCCVSRIFDNRHFWWDVFVGVFIGIVAGTLTVKMCLKAARQRYNISNAS